MLPAIEVVSIDKCGDCSGVVIYAQSVDAALRWWFRKTLKSPIVRECKKSTQTVAVELVGIPCPRVVNATTLQQNTDIYDGTALETVRCKNV